MKAGTGKKTRSIPVAGMLLLPALALLLFGRLPARAQEHAAPSPPAVGRAETPADHARDAHAQPAHGAGGAHGEAHEEEFSIHVSTWLTGLLKQFWYRGPSYLIAAGAVGARPEELVGRRVEYTYVDEHAGPTVPKAARVYRIRPVIRQVGPRTEAEPGQPTAVVTLDGREVTLIQPEVSFPFQSMFPEALVISLLTALFIAGCGLLVTRRLSRIPGKGQVLLELFYERLDQFVRDLMGPRYKKYLPLAITAFLYILLMNLAGLIPGWASPTANINITAGLAIVSVAYAQIEGIRVNGLKGYFRHFIGEPWWLFALNIPIHIIGELAKVLSLTIRLFGNLFGEDVVIVILIALPLMLMKFPLPAQLPMLLFAIFTSFVQAMVFTILTCVYIHLMTAHEGHEEHGHAGGHAHEAAPVHA